MQASSQIYAAIASQIAMLSPKFGLSAGPTARLVMAFCEMLATFVAA